MRHKPTPTFILALPLQVNAQQAARLHAHFECARQLYNALLAEALKRLRRMKADPAWQAARSIPRSDKLARRQVFTRLRTQYGFSQYGLHQAAKRQRASSPQAQGAACRGFVYSVQLILEGYPWQKPTNRTAKGAVGLDLGPSMLAIVPEVGPARLLLLAEELAPDARTRRRLQRHLERERRANNPQHYDAQGRIKKGQGQGRCVWRGKHHYQPTHTPPAGTERKPAPPPH